MGSNLNSRIVRAMIMLTLMAFVVVYALRAWTEERADELGLCGWVKNCDDGSVEVLMEGARPAVDRMLELLHRGPPLASVHEVETTERQFSGDFRHFEVR